MSIQKKEVDLSLAKGIARLILKEKLIHEGKMLLLRKALVRAVEEETFRGRTDFVCHSEVRENLRKCLELSSLPQAEKDEILSSLKSL